MANCATCKHNSYVNLETDWVSCGHRTTLAKQPRWEFGDPIAVNAMTSDWRASEAAAWDVCPTYEQARKGGA